MAPLSSWVVTSSAVPNFLVGFSRSMSSFAGNMLAFNGYTSACFSHGISEPRLANQSTPQLWREYEKLLKKVATILADLAWRDVIISTLVIIAIALAAFFVVPPALDKPPDPAYWPPSATDWYLLWYFGCSRSSGQDRSYVMIGFPS